MDRTRIYFEEKSLIKIRAPTLSRKKTMRVSHLIDGKVPGLDDGIEDPDDHVGREDARHCGRTALRRSHHLRTQPPCINCQQYEEKHF
jgi:hypothetical protein